MDTIISKVNVWIGSRNSRASFGVETPDVRETLRVLFGLAL